MNQEVTRIKDASSTHHPSPHYVPNLETKKYDEAVICLCQAKAVISLLVDNGENDSPMVSHETILNALWCAHAQISQAEKALLEA